MFAGSGNHYAEVQVVEEVYDEEAASTMGLKLGTVCIMLHSGSRGLGHQVAAASQSVRLLKCLKVCTDAVAEAEKVMKQPVTQSAHPMAASLDLYA